MNHLIIIIALLMTFSTQVFAQFDLPNTNYNVGDCITPTDPNWSWFGKSARVEDVVYSNKYTSFFYYLHIPESAVQPFGMFRIADIDEMTFKLRRCPLYLNSK